MWKWLVLDWQWPAAGVFAAAFLLGLLPLIFLLAGLPLMLVYLQLPLYMLHQWEEHRGDRFRTYINRTLAGGREALTPAATFWINALGVWAVDLAALYLAWALAPAAGLAAGYLAVVNALLHLGPALRRREYNPGLGTALFLFLPAGGACIAVVGRAACFEAHAIGLGVALAVHAAVAAHVLLRLRKLRQAGKPQ